MTDRPRVHTPLLLAATLLGSCEAASPPPGVLAQRLPGSILLSELVADPPGSDGSWEFVELLGPPGNALDGYYLYFVDGDAESNPGLVDRVTDLGPLCDGGCRLGANGVALLGPSGGRVPLDPSTSVLVVPTSTTLENGSLSVILAECDARPEATDVDPFDSGMLELPIGCTLVDAVGWTDGDAGDSAYGASVSSRDPGALTRVSDAGTPLGAAAWISGELTGGSDSLTYSEWSCPALTPGAPNPSCEGDFSTPSSGGRPNDTTGTPANGSAAQTDTGTALGSATPAGGRSGWDDSLVNGGAAALAGAATGSEARPAPPRAEPPSACQCAGASPSVSVADWPPFVLLLLLVHRRGSRRSAAWARNADRSIAVMRTA